MPFASEESKKQRISALSNAGLLIPQARFRSWAALHTYPICSLCTPIAECCRETSHTPEPSRGPVAALAGAVTPGRTLPGLPSLPSYRSPDSTHHEALALDLRERHKQQANTRLGCALHQWRVASVEKRPLPAHDAPPPLVRVSRHAYLQSPQPHPHSAPSQPSHAHLQAPGASGSHAAQNVTNSQITLLQDNKSSMQRLCDRISLAPGGLTGLPHGALGHQHVPRSPEGKQ